jgi:1-acyl-sn-glycerol-3-phosphate acyltransferase
MPHIARVNAVRGAWRVLRLVLHLLQGLWILRTRFEREDATGQRLLVQQWSAQALQVMGVRLQVLGQEPAGALLVVANHMSWLDIIVMNAACPSRFVSKSDVKQWPVVGRLVEASGTLFIERDNRRDALRVVHHMAECLRAGERLAVFPEGTTSDGQQVLPFHANLLQAAVATEAAVCPVGLRYASCQAFNAEHTVAQEAPLGVPAMHPAPLYINDDTLVNSIWRTVRAADLCAVVRWGEPDTAQGRDRRTWAHALREQVAQLAGLSPA